MAAQVAAAGEGASRFTHCGVVVRGEDIPAGTRHHRPGAVYIFESVASGPLPESDGVRNVDGQAFLGVQLRDLDKVVAAYDADASTRIAWCKLSASPDRGRWPAIFQHYNGVRYDVCPLSVFASAFPCLRPFRCCGGATDWMICSELVAHVYVDLGLMEVTPENVVPADFFQKPDGQSYDIDGEVPQLFATIVPFTVRSAAAGRP